MEKVEKSNLILVTAITPTKAGIGKTTTSIGLAQGMQQLGKKAVLALREPSLGPCFGMKGGATVGGYSQVLPMEEINLHFEIQESMEIISNYIINFEGANACDCPKGYNEEDDDPNENRINERDPYENFHWGGLSGEEAYIGYWNTD